MCCLATKSCPNLCQVHKTPLSMGFPRQEHWSGLPFPSPGDLPDPGIKPTSPALGSGFFTAKPPRKPPRIKCCSVAKSCPALCDPMNCSIPGFSVHHNLPDFAQTHVHWVGDAIQPFHPLSPPSSLALNLSQPQGLFQWDDFTSGANMILKREGRF